ncbi:MAG: hypothetical protein IKL89_01370 [Clostridia bacterium]|nr:hypothetical protein [Clostridia bacterium]
MRLKKLFGTALFCLLLLCVMASPSLAHAPEEAYGFEFLAGERNGENRQKFYRELYLAAEEFLAAGRDAAPEDGYVIAALDYEALGVDAYTAVEIWKIFFVDHPEYYWLANRATVSANRLNMYVYAEYAAAAERRNTDRALEAGKKLILSAADGLTGDVERAVAIHNRLLEVAVYLYGEDGKTPSDAPFAHNIVGVLTGLGGVCDGYAKAYALLLREAGIPCLFVDGIAEDIGHAWNIARLDGSWYWIDPTWNDREGAADYRYFGPEPALFLQQHAPHTNLGSGAAYLYTLPETAEEALPLTLLYREDQPAGIFGSPAAALAAIQPGEDRWSMRLPARDGASRVWSLPAGKLPAVGLTILSDDRESPTPLVLEGPVTASGELTIENIVLMPAPGELRLSLDMMGHALTFRGHGGGAALYDEADRRVANLRLDATGSTVHLKTESFSWDGDFSAACLNADGGRISFGAGRVEIAELRVLADGLSLYFSDTSDSPVLADVRRVYLGAPCSVSMTSFRKGNAVTFGALTGNYRMAIAMGIGNVENLPALRLERVAGIAVDMTVKTYTEDEYIHPGTGEIEILRESADLTGFDGRLCYAPDMDLAKGSVYFLLADRTVNLSADAMRSEDGYVRVPVTDKLTGTQPMEPEPPVSHEFGDFITLRAATCRKSGEAYRVCRLCGIAEYRLLPMAEHKYGPWRTTTRPTVATTGERRRTCSVCGHGESEEIAMLNPVPTQAAKPTGNPVPSGAAPTPAATPSAPEKPERRLGGWIVWMLIGTCGIVGIGLAAPEAANLLRRRKDTKK